MERLGELAGELGDLRDEHLQDRDQAEDDLAASLVFQGSGAALAGLMRRASSTSAFTRPE